MDICLLVYCSFTGTCLGADLLRIGVAQWGQNTIGSRDSTGVRTGLVYRGRKAPFAFALVV